METVVQITDFRLELTNDLYRELDSERYLASSRIKIGIVTRKRLLTPTNLIVMIIRFKTSVQRELNSLSNSDFNIREATKGAFSQVRAKLNPWFKRLNEVAVASFYKGLPYHKWYGKRVLAVDGIPLLLLLNHSSVIKELGQHGMGANGDCQRSMAIGFILYDVLNQIAIDAPMAPYASSETSLCLDT